MRRSAPSGAVPCASRALGVASKPANGVGANFGASTPESGAPIAGTSRHRGAHHRGQGPDCDGAWTASEAGTENSPRRSPCTCSRLASIEPTRPPLSPAPRNAVSGAPGASAGGGHRHRRRDEKVAAAGGNRTLSERFRDAEDQEGSLRQSLRLAASLRAARSEGEGLLLPTCHSRPRGSRSCSLRAAPARPSGSTRRAARTCLRKS